MERKQISHVDHNAMADGTTYESKLEGIVDSIKSEIGKETIFTIRTKKGKEEIKVPLRMRKKHERELIGSKIRYNELEVENRMFVMTGFEFHADGPEPIGEWQICRDRRYSITVLNGEFKGKLYDGQTKEGWDEAFKKMQKFKEKYIK
jgi:hypothetical protein